MGHDDLRAPVPDAAAGRSIAAPGNADRHGVDAVTQEPEDGGQQRQRGCHGSDDDDDRADSHASEDALGDNDEAGESDHDGHTGEEDRSTCRATGLFDGRVARKSAGAFFAEALDDQQRIVDADCEAHGGDDVHDEDREFEGAPNDRGQTNGNDDRENTEKQRHSGGYKGAEDHHENDESDGQANDFGGLKVAFGGFIEGDGSGSLATNNRSDAVPTVHAVQDADDCLRLILGISTRDDHGNDEGPA